MGKRRILVTGGGSGLGAALVARALGQGDSVTVIDRDPAPQGCAAAWVQLDLTDLDALTRLDLTGLGPFDLVIHSAGISAAGRFETVPEAAQHTVLAVNLTAPMVLTAAMMQAGSVARGGRLVFVGSLSIFTGYPGAAVYGGTKDGLVSFARSLRRPLWRAGRIRVQVVAPGPMDTPHAARYAPPGSDGRARLAPDRVAAHILSGRGGLICVPGGQARLLALLGRLAPDTMTLLMRRVIWAKYPVDPDKPLSMTGPDP